MSAVRATQRRVSLADNVALRQTVHRVSHSMLMLRANATTAGWTSSPGSRLKGKVAIVTGSGSSGSGWGTGKAIAVAMAREGADVGLVNISAAAAEETASIIRSEGGRCCVLPRCNVASATEVQSAFAVCKRELGPESVLVNNVGRVCPGDVMNVPLDKWEQINAMNLIGAFNCTKSSVASMLQAGHAGSIINIGSISGIRRLRAEVAYCCSKAAVNSLTVSVAREFAAQQIRCNAVLPGIIDTPLVAKAFQGQDLEKVMAERHAMSPTGRMGDAWDIAHACVYLASDEARYTNGLIMPIDGGFTSQLLPDTASASHLHVPQPTLQGSDFQGKVVLLTGAGSTVGQEIARSFLAQGAKVFAAENYLIKVQAVCSASNLERVVAHACDDSEDAVQAMVRRCIDLFGKIDYLVTGPLPVNAAGLLDTTTEDFARIYHKGVTAVLLAMRFVLPHMVSRGSGAIVSMSSLAATRFLRPEIAHAAAAGSVNALIMQTAAEFAARGVRCNAVASIAVDGGTPQDVDAYASGIAQGTLHLCSDKARYTNGHILTLDMSASAHMTVNI